MNITKYPEGVEEVINHMDFMPNDHEARENLLWSFVNGILFY